MPVVCQGGKMPEWCEMESFQLISLAERESASLPPTGDKEQLIVCEGMVKVEATGIDIRLDPGGKLDLDDPNRPSVRLRAVGGPALVFHASGRWESVASSGIFPAGPGEPPANESPHDYPKSTTFDNHYHDCDEYWIFLNGRCRVVTEGRFYDVGPGDCVVTGMGWHHDIQHVFGDEWIRGVWFEGTLEGLKRVGHLWEPIHGKAEPRAERV